MNDFSVSGTPRRGFLGRIAASIVGLGAVGLAPVTAHAADTPSSGVDPELEAWFAKLTGKHRAVFDAPAPNEGMPAIWPRVYLITTEATYPGESASAMVILRHSAIGLAMQDALWTKYKFGEMFNIKPNGTAATKNPYASITGLPLPGLGIAEFAKSNVLVGVCDLAMTVNSNRAAAAMGMEGAAVKKEWVAGLFPGVQIVPSGVMAAARAQELGGKYIFAG